MDVECTLLRLKGLEAKIKRLECHFDTHKRDVYSMCKLARLYAYRDVLLLDIKVLDNSSQICFN